MLRLQSSKLVSEVEAPSNLPDLLVRTTADFELKVDDETLYAEPDFPVIELAAALVHWSSLPVASRPDFEFDSMSTPEPGWVWVRRVTGGWRVGSVHQSRASVTAWSEPEVQSAIEEFVSHVVICARECLGIEVGQWVPGFKQ